MASDSLSNEQKLLELFEECTVWVSHASGGASGTGFFVAPGLVLTCAHVVEEMEAQAIQIQWQGQKLTAKAVRLAHGEPTAVSEGTSEEPPDLALIEIRETAHPCVLLFGTVAINESLYSYGYPQGSSIQGPPRADPVTTVFEGTTRNPRLLKFKEGQIQHGHSGSPVLNLRTGAVCGLVSWTRGQFVQPNHQPFILDIGGLGIPVDVILTCYPELALLNARFHAADDRWIRLLAPKQRKLIEGVACEKRWLSLAAAFALLGPIAVGIILQDGTQPLQLIGPWKFVGPSWAFVSGLDVDPRDSQTVYAALGNDQGVFRSDDGGFSWAPKSIGLTVRTTKAVAVSPHDGTVFVGTEKGLWFSEDRGETWAEQSRYRGSEIVRVVLSPHEPKFLLVGTLKPGGVSFSSSSVAVIGQASKPADSIDTGHLHITRDGESWLTFPVETVNDACVASDDSQLAYVASADGGLYRTRDGFDTIELVETFSGKQPLSVAIAPHDGKVVMVGTLHGGLYRSSDGGNSWTKVEVVGDIQVSQIIFPRADGKHVLAATRGGVFESFDGGLVWQPVNQGLAYNWAMSVKTTADGAVLCGTSGGGVYRRALGQKNWIPQNHGFPPASGLVLAPAGGQLLFAATSIGLFKSRDAGATWEFVGFAAEPVTALTLPNQDMLRPDGGAESGLHISRDRGQSVQNNPTTGIRPLLIYVGTHNGNVYRSGDGGKTWEKLTSASADAPPWGREQVLTVAIAPGTADTVYVVVEHMGIWRSQDSGLKWDLMGAEVCGQRVNSVLVSTRDSRHLLAATIDKGVCISSDGGDTWQVASVLAGEPLTDVVESRRSPGMAFAVALSRAVYRSIDGGRNWKLLRPSDQLPDQQKWATLAVSPDDAKLVVGSSRGAYYSADGGQNWKPVPGGVLGTDYYVNHLIFAEDSGALYGAMTNGIFMANFEQWE